jgi:hypothetical protein
MTLKSNRRSFLQSLLASPVALFARKRVEEPEKEILWPVTKQPVPTGGIIYGNIEYMVGEEYHCQVFPLALHPINSVDKLWINDKEIPNTHFHFTYPMVTLPYKDHNAKNID